MRQREEVNARPLGGSETEDRGGIKTSWKQPLSTCLACLSARVNEYELLLTELPSAVGSAINHKPANGHGVTVFGQ
jgi:hypothetical protein